MWINPWQKPCRESEIIGERENTRIGGGVGWSEIGVDRVSHWSSLKIKHHSNNRVQFSLCTGGWSCVYLRCISITSWYFELFSWVFVLFGACWLDNVLIGSVRVGLCTLELHSTLMAENLSEITDKSEPCGNLWQFAGFDWCPVILNGLEIQWEVDNLLVGNNFVIIMTSSNVF